VVHGVTAPNHSIAYEEQQHMNIYHKYPQGYYVYYYLRSQDSSVLKHGKAGTPYYVGKGKDRRAWCGHTKTIKLPKDKQLIIVIAENLTEETAFQLEKLHIQLWGRADLGTGILRNRTDGGDGASGTVRSQETREKIRQTLKSKPGKKHSESTKALMRIRNKQKVLSQDAKARMLQGLEAGRGHKTPETRAKISAARKGTSISTEHREALKRAWQTRDRTPHNKGTTSPRTSCVHCRKNISASHLTTHKRYHCS
jgi:plasmid stability protein